MNNFITTLLIFCISIFAKNVQAHNAEIATFTIHQKGAMYMLKIDLAQLGVDGAMAQLHPDLDLENIDLNIYKELIIKYLKQSISISSINGEKIKLGEGGIKLGAHQTSLKFVLEGFPKVANGLEVTIDSFSKNANQNNILRLLINGEKRKYFLKKTNDFSTNILYKTTAHQSKENKSYFLELLFLSIVFFKIIFDYFST